MFMNTCNSTKDLKEVGYKIVVCVDTDDSVGGQVDNVNNVNVAGGLFISNSSLIDFFLESSFPAVFINPKDGQSILNYMKMNSDPRASLQFQKTRIGRRRNKPAPRVADYSSRGPSHSCPSVLKPDIMAPGTLVLAAWPKTTVALDTGSRLLYNDYNFLSGTSMSCPQLADINYPSFIAFFNVNDSSSDAKMVQEFKRTVTNVGNGASTYMAKLTPMDGIQVTVTPEALVFKEKYEKQSFKVSLEGPKMMKHVVAHCALSWVEVGGKYIVRSPIVATRLSSVPFVSKN
ncbi:hypothetical protein MKX03_018772 [Papaver bracteatum]|nr:hypothetical protein MKX03_018772 [Papaver bracteatum]